MCRVVCGWIALHAKETWRGVEQVYTHYCMDWVEKDGLVGLELVPVD